MHSNLRYVTFQLKRKVREIFIVEMIDINRYNTYYKGLESHVFDCANLFI